MMRRFALKNETRVVSIALSILMIVLLTPNSFEVQAFTSTDAPYTGNGSSSSPYVYCLSSDSDSATWKSLVDLRYPFLKDMNFGPERAQPLTKVLEVRQGNSSSGQLLYAWKFDGGSIKSGLQPADLPPEGGAIPYYEQQRQPNYLGLSFTKDTSCTSGLPAGFNESTSMFVTCKMKTDFTTDQVALTLRVAEHFYDGTKLTLYFYGGNTGANMEGKINPHAPRIIQTGITVSGGYVQFSLTHGGSYVLMDESPTPSAGTPPQSGTVSSAKAGTASATQSTAAVIHSTTSAATSSAQQTANANGIALTEIKVDGEAEALQGDGSAANPFVFLTQSVAKVTWKQLNKIRENGWTELYETREGDIPTGKLQYCWLFSASAIVGEPEGPYQLHISFEPDENYDLSSLPHSNENRVSALWITFQHNRALPGKVTVKVNVNGKFKDGDTVYLYYYGGGNGDIIHSGMMPVADNPETTFEPASDAITVQNGYAEFRLTRGGNYYLSSIKESASGGDTAGYISHGIISQTFQNPAVAKAIADALGKKVENEFTQSDLGLIRTLSFYGDSLTDISDLKKVQFSSLQSLDLSNNQLTSIPDFQNMPALTTLLLNNNQLATVPDFSLLLKLTALNLSHNRLVSVPAFTKLTSLKSLDLSDNKLTAVPTFELPELKFLGLAYNRLYFVPDVSGLPSLTDLTLSGNAMWHVPTLSQIRSGAKSLSVPFTIGVIVLCILVLMAGVFAAHGYIDTKRRCRE